VVDLNLTVALALVLLFTVLHGAMYVRFHRRLSLVAGSAWVLYGIYEGRLDMFAGVQHSNRFTAHIPCAGFAVLCCGIGSLREMPSLVLHRKTF